MLKAFLAAALLLAASMPTMAASYQLEINNPHRLPILSVTVHRSKVTGEVCGNRAVCNKTVTLPDNSCVEELRVTVGNTIHMGGFNMCGQTGVLSITIER